MNRTLRLKNKPSPDRRPTPNARPAPKKPKPKSSLLDELIGKEVKVFLLGGEQKTGELVEVALYDIALRHISGTIFIVHKGSLLWAQELG
jgi:hypothetical protein